MHEPEPKYLSGAAYRLGEECIHYRSIENHVSRLRDLKVPVAPHMGLGSCYRTQDIYRLAGESIAATIANSRLPPAAIDHVLFCSSQFPDTFQHRNRGLGATLTGNGVSPNAVHGISGTGCADVLHGIEVACDLINLGKAETVLLVGLEMLHAATPAARILEYALVSDAVVSLLISRAPPPADEICRIATCMSVSSVADIGAGMGLRRPNGYQRSAAAALRASDLLPGDITKTFGSNTYLPIKIQREGSAGFSRDQLFLQNVERTGHCLACDPIVNFADFDNRGPRANYLLFAEAEGHAAAVVLRR